MDMQMILDYLTELSANNNREWYHAHKAEYQAANAQFEELIQALILRIGEFDGSILGHAPKELTFKLARDTRFSHDKSPYNPAFRAHISSMGSRVDNPFWAAACLLICSRPLPGWCGIISRNMETNGIQSSLHHPSRNALL